MNVLAITVGVCLHLEDGRVILCQTPAVPTVQPISLNDAAHGAATLAYVVVDRLNNHEQENFYLDLGRRYRQQYLTNDAEDNPTIPWDEKGQYPDIDYEV